MPSQMPVMTRSYNKRTDSKPYVADDTCSVSTNQITSNNPFCDNVANHFYIHCVQPLNTLLSNSFQDGRFDKKERLLVEEAFRQERCAVIAGKGVDAVLMEKHLRRKRIAEQRKMRERQLAKMQAQAEIQVRRQRLESKNDGKHFLLADDGTHDSSDLGSLIITENEAKPGVRVESSTIPRTEPEPEPRLVVSSFKDASGRVRNMLLRSTHQHVNKTFQQPMVAMKKVWNSPTKPSVNKKGFNVKATVFSRQSKNGCSENRSADDDTLSLSNPPSESSCAGNDLTVTEVCEREFPVPSVTVEQAQKAFDSKPIVASARKAVGRDTSQKSDPSDYREGKWIDACVVALDRAHLITKEGNKNLLLVDNDCSVENRQVEKPKDGCCSEDKTLTRAASPWDVFPSSKSDGDEILKPHVKDSNRLNETKTEKWWEEEEELLDPVENCAGIQSEDHDSVTITAIEDTCLLEQGTESNERANADILGGLSQRKDDDQFSNSKDNDLDMDDFARSISGKYSTMTSRRINEEARNVDKLFSLHDVDTNAETQLWGDINESILCRNMMCGEKEHRHIHEVYRADDYNSFCTDNTEPTDERLPTPNISKMLNRREYSSTSHENLTRQCVSSRDSMTTGEGNSVGVDSPSCNGKNHGEPEISHPSVITIPLRAQRSVENSPTSLIDESTRSDERSRVTVDMNVPRISSDLRRNTRDKISATMLNSNEIERSSFSSCVSHDAAKSSEMYRMRMNRSMNSSHLASIRAISHYENTATLHPEVVDDGRNSLIDEHRRSHHTRRMTKQEHQYEEKLRAAKLRQTQIHDTHYEMKPLAFSSYFSHDVGHASVLRYVSSRRDANMSIIDDANCHTFLEESGNSAYNELEHSAIISRFSCDLSKANNMNRPMMIRREGSNDFAVDQPGSLRSSHIYDQEDEDRPHAEDDFHLTGFDIRNSLAYGPEGGSDLVARGRKSRKSSPPQHLFHGLGNSTEDFQYREVYGNKNRNQLDSLEDQCALRRLRLQQTFLAEADQDSHGKLIISTPHSHQAKEMAGSISTNRLSLDWNERVRFASGNNELSVLQTGQLVKVRRRKIRSRGQRQVAY
ncbi:hypothetical protein HJC23_007302 [Cyclotella cryptica]|uniref:Uncharacterized protein n=1 Tax=Cyclotella cryptica TaxID=29204 RepID=A0ABD3P0E7_9STRA|eukprot:CCRYP_018333-RA/>CCRYP_018333-RA protein AED:0.07 eAED:0.07 QI:0/-1/0/1/-1/1/1/0/1087